jgi:hypothetical protein
MKQARLQDHETNAMLLHWSTENIHLTFGAMLGLIVGPVID